MALRSKAAKLAVSTLRDIGQGYLRASLVLMLLWLVGSMTLFMMNLDYNHKHKAQ